MFPSRVLAAAAAAFSLFFFCILFFFLFESNFFFCSIFGYHNRQCFRAYEMPSFVVEEAVRDDIASDDLQLPYHCQEIWVKMNAIALRKLTTQKTTI